MLWGVLSVTFTVICCAGLMLNLISRALINQPIVKDNYSKHWPCLISGS